MMVLFHTWRTVRAVERMLVLVLLVLATQAAHADEFPFGQEMTLDAHRLAGSKRMPSIEIDERGGVRLELWCRGGSGQVSVAGDTIVFVPGTIEERGCPADKAQMDDELVAALGAATNWKRQGDDIAFIGAKTLRFHLNTN